MKIASPDILHKSDVGGILLDLQDENAVRSGYAQLMKRVKVIRPDAKIEGVHLQRQIPEGQEGPTPRSSKCPSTSSADGPKLEDGTTGRRELPHHGHAGRYGLRSDDHR